MTSLQMKLEISCGSITLAKANSDLGEGKLPLESNLAGKYTVNTPSAGTSLNLQRSKTTFEIFACNTGKALGDLNKSNRLLLPHILGRTLPSS